MDLMACTPPNTHHDVHGDDAYQLPVLLLRPLQQSVVGAVLQDADHQVKPVVPFRPQQQGGAGG